MGSTGIDPDSVNEGDTVTVLVRGREDFTVRGKAYQDWGTDGLRVGGWAIRKPHVSLIEHKPAGSVTVRKLPTTNGSVVIQSALVSGAEWGPVAAILRNGEWVDTADWNRKLYPDRWDTGWDLVREATETTTREKLIDILRDFNNHPDATNVADDILALFAEVRQG